MLWINESCTSYWEWKGELLPCLLHFRFQRMEWCKLWEIQFLHLRVWYLGESIAHNCVCWDVNGSDMVNTVITKFASHLEKQASCFHPQLQNSISKELPSGNPSLSEPISFLKLNVMLINVFCIYFWWASAFLQGSHSIHTFLRKLNEKQDSRMPSVPGIHFSKDRILADKLLIILYDKLMLLFHTF